MPAKEGAEYRRRETVKLRCNDMKTRLTALCLSLLLITSCSSSPDSASSEAMVLFGGCAAGSKDQCERLDALAAKMPLNLRKGHFFKLCYKYGSEPACEILEELKKLPE